MTHSELIEAMARAIWNTRGYAHSSDDRMFEPLEYGDEGEYAPLRAECQDAARAALAVVREVLEEPTERMINAGRDLQSREVPRLIWGSTLAASPLYKETK